MELVINNNLYAQAQTYAQQQGLNLTTMIENFLIRFVKKNETKTAKNVVPDVVLSLLGAVDVVSDNDLNEREAYYHYLEEKYQ